MLHVRNLTRNVNEEHLREIFGNYGSIKNVELAIDALVQLPKGYAFIEFASVDLAKAAVQHMDGGQIDSNVVSVALAVTVPRISCLRTDVVGWPFPIHLRTPEQQQHQGQTATHDRLRRGLIEPATRHVYSWVGI